MTDTENMTIWKLAKLYEAGTLANLSYNELSVAQTNVASIAQSLEYFGAAEMAMTVQLTNGEEITQVVTPDLLQRIDAVLTDQLATRYGCDD